jgi:hypothetical protein
MSAIVEYLNNILVDHYIPKYFFGKPESFKLAQFIHMPNIEQKCVSTII